MTEKLNDLLQQVDLLSVDDKILILQQLLKSTGLQVVMGGGNFISADVVLQIQNGSPEALIPIFQLLAERVAGNSNLNSHKV